MVTGGCCCFGPWAQTGRRPEERGELAFLKSLRGSAKFLHKDPPTPLGAHAPPAPPTAPSGRRPRSWLAPTGSRLPRCQGHPTQTAARRRPGPPPAGAGRAGALGTPTGWALETAAEARSPGLMTAALPRPRLRGAAPSPLRSASVSPSPPGCPGPRPTEAVSTGRAALSPAADGGCREGRAVSRPVAGLVHAAWLPGSGVTVKTPGRLLCL